MIKTKCVMCDCDIANPVIGRLYCKNPKCKKEFNTLSIELWKFNNPDRVKETNRKAYLKRLNLEEENGV